MQIKLRYHVLRLESHAQNLNELLRSLQNCRVAELRNCSCRIAKKFYETENCRIAFATVAVAELQLQLQQFCETGPWGVEEVTDIKDENIL